MHLLYCASNRRAGGIWQNRRVRFRLWWFAPLLFLVTGCSGPAAGPSARPSAEAKPGPKRITQFYASPPKIAAGDSALLCYGVQDVAWVKLDPPVEPVHPALSRCFAVAPAKTTEYTLSVEGEQQTTRVEVGAAAPEKSKLKAPKTIRFFVADLKQARPGQTVTLCYGVLDAKSVRLDPGGRTLPAVERSCVQQPVSATTTYTLTVEGKDGSEASTQLVVAVK